MATRWTAVLAMLVVIGTAEAENSGKKVKESLAEQLDLFSLCSPGGRMDLAVSERPGHAARAGLRRDGVREAIESRLRRVRLLDPNAEPLLHAAIVVGEPKEEHIPFYSIKIGYLRELTAERIGVTSLAETWSTGGAGQGDADSFLDHLGSLVDTFVAEYLRVRDSAACVEARKPRPAEPAADPEVGSRKN